MKCIGIDLGYKSIKVVEVDGDYRKFNITKSHEYNLNRTPNEDIQIQLLQTLKEISQDFDVKDNVVITSVSQESVTHRLLDFPFVERTKILKSIPFEMEEEIPFSVDDCVFDGSLVSREMGLTKILGTLTTKREVATLIENFTKAGINPDIISTESNAIANLYRGQYNFESQPGELTLRIQIGYSKTNLLFFKDKNLTWVRTILWGAKNMSDSVAKAFHISLQDADRLMPEKSFLLLTPAGATVDQMRMSDSLEGSLKPLLEQIRLTLVEIKSILPDPVNSIKLIGPAGKIPNLSAHITSKLSLTTNYENILESQSVTLGNDPSQFMTALGLALEGFKRPQNPAVNFRQAEFAKKGIGFEKVWEKWGHAIQLCLAAYFVYLFYGMTRESIAVDLDDKSQGALTEVAAKVANLKGKSASRSNLEKYINNQKKYLKDAKTFAKIDDINSAMSILEKISSKLPSNTTTAYDVRRFDLKNDIMTIEGTTTSLQIVNSIKSAIETFSLPKSTKKIQPTIKKEEGKEIFAFSSKVKRNG